MEEELAKCAAARSITFNFMTVVSVTLILVYVSPYKDSYSYIKRLMFNAKSYMVQHEQSNFNVRMDPQSRTLNQL